MSKCTSQKQFNALAAKYRKTEKLYRWQGPDSIVAELDLLDLETTSPLKVLLLGAGTGTDAARVKEKLPQAEIHGCDLSQSMLDIATDCGHIDADKTKVADLSQSAPYDNNSFDLVICCGTAEYLGEPKRLINEMARITKPGGHIISTFRKNTVTNIALHWIGAVQNAISFIPFIDPVGHKTTTTEDELTSIAQNEMENVHCSAPYTAYYQNMIPYTPKSGPPVTYITLSAQKPT